MEKENFNGNASDKTLNEYVLTLVAHAGVVPLRGSNGKDRDPAYQAALFREQMTDWLEANHEYENHNVLTTAVLPPAADGLPRMSITSTAAALARVQQQFGNVIKFTELVKENVSTRRVIKRPGTGPAPKA